MAASKAHRQRQIEEARPWAALRGAALRLHEDIRRPPALQDQLRKCLGHYNLTVMPEGTRFDTPRNAAATVAFREGVPGKVVLEMLGRSSIAQTLDTSGRVMPGLRADAAKKLDPALF